MRREVMIMAMGAVLALSLVPGCTTSTGSANQFGVESQAAKGVDFHNLKFWRWKPGTRHGAERGEGNAMKMQDEKLRAVIESELNGRGYPMAPESRVDFYVSFRLSSFHTARTQANAAQTTGANEPGPVGSQLSRSGSLTISFWLAGRSDPIWTGTAAGTGAGFLRTEEQYRRAVRAILANFPPL